MKEFTRNNLDFVLRHYRKGALNTQKAIERFNAEISARTRTSAGVQTIRTAHRTNILAVIVSAAAAVIVGVFIYVNTGARRWTELVTADAVQTWILPDSTSVTAAPNSTVSFRKGSAFRKHRRLEMTGKVFFNVTHDPRHPFEVSSEGGYVKVLGTEFQIENIKELENQRGKSRIEVSVRSGKVFFSKSPESRGIVLTKGEAASLDIRETIPVPINHAPNPDVWATGIFIYEGVPLREVLDELSGYYGVDLSCQLSGQEEKRLTGELSSASLDEIISVIEDALDVEIEKN